MPHAAPSSAASAHQPGRPALAGLIGLVLDLGVRWKMWSPNHHSEFPVGFRKTVNTMIMASRRPESLMYLLHDEIVLFIMNKCWRGCMSCPERRLGQCHCSLPRPPGADSPGPWLRCALGASR